MVAEIGFEAMMKGEADVVRGWKNKIRRRWPMSRLPRFWRNSTGKWPSPVQGSVSRPFSLAEQSASAAVTLAGSRSLEAGPQLADGRPPGPHSHLPLGIRPAPHLRIGRLHRPKARAKGPQGSV